MKHFSKTDIKEMERVYRLNLINSCTGYKSANLIGSISTNNVCNVAVFSSITHLGSDPALLTFIVRPTTVPRDTYKNIIDTKEFTVNHINVNDIEDAHHTSARYPAMISEFDTENEVNDSNNESHGSKRVIVKIKDPKHVIRNRK